MTAELPDKALAQVKNFMIMEDLARDLLKELRTESQVTGLQSVLPGYLTRKVLQPDNRDCQPTILTRWFLRNYRTIL